MTQDSTRLEEVASRRKFLLSTGAAGLTMLAGCSQSNDGEEGGDDTQTDGMDTENSDQSTQNNEESNESGLDTTVLTGDGSSTVFPITNTGASYWNSNPEAGDGDYWPTEWADEYGTDMRLADYFAQQYGYEPTGERSRPSFRVSIALSHSGTGVEGVMEGRVDIGDSSASAEAELAGSDASDETLDNFVEHVVGVDGQPIVASNEIVEAGVTEITIEELRAIYRQEITNWSELGGPDRDILALGRAEGSGTDTSFRSNVFGDPNAPISPDQRFGQNQQLQQAITQADNAISYIALAFVEPDGATPPIGLELDGTLYEYGKNLGAKGYPLSRDLHCYTYEDTDRRESAFINMILTEFGQTNFVEPNNYFTLPPERREEERAKLAEQV